MSQDASLEAITAENAKLRRELGTLRERVAWLEAELKRVQQDSIRGATDGSGESNRAVEEPARETARQHNVESQRLVDANIIGILIADVAGNILEANDFFLDITGYTREDWAAGAVNWLDLTPAEYLPRDEQALVELWTTGRVIPFEKEYFRKDGSRVPILIGAAVLDPVARTWICFVLDLTERKRAESELRQMSDRLEHLVQERTAELVAANQALSYQAFLLQNVGDTIVATDADFRITAWNRAAEEIFGWQAEEVLGRPAQEIAVQIADASEVNQIVESVLTAGRFESEGPIRSRDGTSFCLESSVVQLKDPAGRFAGIIAIARDVSKRKQAEAEKAASQEALAASQQRFRALFEHSMDAILLADDEACYVDANPAACQMLGRTREELLRSTVWDVTPVQNREVAFQLWRSFIAAGMQESEFLLARPDGTIVDAEYCAVANVLPGLHMSQLRDITQRKQAEAALRASEERYRSIYENSSDGIMLTAPDGRILSANPAACAMLGYSEEEICQLGRGGTVDSSDPRLPGYLQERTRTGHVRGELLFIHKDGHRFPADMTSTVFEDMDGNLRTSIIMRDMSERAQAMALLELRVAERTRELSTLLEVSRNIASTLELRPLLDTILAQLRNVLDYLGGGINILTGNELVLVSYDGPIPWETIKNFRIPLDEGTILRDVVVSRSPVIVGDVWSDDPKWRNTYKTWKQEIDQNLPGVHSWMGVPLIAFGKLIGVLRLDHQEVNHFTEEHARIATAFADQVAVAIQNARLYQKAQELAAWEERQRMGRDLHDSIAQSLYGISLGLKTAQKQLRTDPDGVVETLAHLVWLSDTTFADIRAVVAELQPESSHLKAVVAAIAHQAQILQARRNVKVTLDLCEEPTVPAKVKEDLYRIAREVLHNIFKHAQATQVTVRLMYERGVLKLEIADDGVGFDSETGYADTHGLQLMSRRIARRNGTLTINSSVGAGTQVCVELPVHEEDDISFLWEPVTLG